MTSFHFAVRRRETLWHSDDQLIYTIRTMYQLGTADPFPDSKVHGANMGPIWGRQDPGGPHVGTMNFAIWVYFVSIGDVAFVGVLSSI